MGARDWIYGPEKPRAVWRISFFLLLAAPAFWLLAVLLRSVLPEWPAGAVGLMLDSGALVLALVAASYAMMRWVERRPIAALGLPSGRPMASGFLLGSVVGGVIIAAVVAVQVAAGWMEPAADAGTTGEWLSRVGGLALLFLVAAAAEELLFRGYPFQVLVEGLGPVLAVIVAAALFALAHATNPWVDGLALLNIGLAGVVMAVAYLRTWSLWVPLGLHWAWNWVMAALFDLPVSGLSFDVPGYDLRAVGPRIVTGGPFGPEAGLLATVASGAAIAWLLRTGRLSRSEHVAALGPLVGDRGGGGDTEEDDRLERKRYG